MEFCDPNKVNLPTNRKLEIHSDTEAELLEVDPANWTPIKLQGSFVIDGAQRVMVARKHNIPAIPFDRYKR